MDVSDEAQAEGGRLDDLYVRHAPAAIGLAYLLTGDRLHAEDLAHEAFARLAGSFLHLRKPEAFQAYLRRTIVNLHRSRLRRLRTERAFLRRERPATSAAPTDVADRHDLWALLLALPERQRAAVVLRYYEDLSERETAEVLRCSVAAVKSLVARAMQTLRERLRGEET